MRLALIATAAAAMAAAAIAGSASGAAQPGTYNFHDCSGPPGTPSGFTGVKEYLPDSSRNGVSASIAFRMSTGGVFIALAFGGYTIAPGIPDNVLTTTCLVDFAQPYGTLPVSGFIAP